MRSLVFEGNTWAIYEDLRTRDSRLHKALCVILKDNAAQRPGGRNRQAGGPAS